MRRLKKGLQQPPDNAYPVYSFQGRNRGVKRQWCEVLSTVRRTAKIELPHYIRIRVIFIAMRGYPYGRRLQLPVADRPGLARRH